MGGRSPKGTNNNNKDTGGFRGAIGRIPSRDLFSYSQDDLTSNYNQTVYPEYDQFLKRVDKATPEKGNPEANMLSMLKDAPNQAKFDYWKATEGQDIGKNKSAKYPELVNERSISQKDINKMSKDALNILGFNSMGVWETGAFTSMNNLSEKAGDATELLEEMEDDLPDDIPLAKLNNDEFAKAVHGAIQKLKDKADKKGRKLENSWAAADLNDPKVIEDLKFHSGLSKLMETYEPGAMNIILNYWLLYGRDEHENPNKAKEEQDHSPFDEERIQEYPGYATPAPPVGSKQELVNWDPYTRRYVPQDEVDTSKAGADKLKNEIIVGEDDGMSDLLKVFKKGDKIRFVKLGDEHSEDKELKQSVALVHNLLFGENQSSILNQAVEGAYKMSPTTFNKNKDEITKKLADVSIVFSFDPLANNAEMQYNPKEKFMIVPITTAERMLRALKTEDTKTIKEIHESAYHELTHAIHQAIKGEERSRAIHDEYVADAFARMALMTKERDREHVAANKDSTLMDKANTFEQAKERGYDPVIRELLQDKIFENTIPEELLSVDPITRKPTLKDVPPENKEKLLKEAVENRRKAIEKMQKTMTDVATNLVELSTFKDRLDPNDAEKLDDYIKKSTTAHEMRKAGSGKKSFVPALQPEDRLKLETLFKSDDPFEQSSKESVLTDLHRVLIGSKIPPSIINALQIISLSEAGVLVPVDHLSRARRALTKESKRLQSVMEQDTKDFETALRILYSIPK